MNQLFWKETVNAGDRKELGVVPSEDNEVIITTLGATVQICTHEGEDIEIEMVEGNADVYYGITGEELFIRAKRGKGRGSYARDKIAVYLPESIKLKTLSVFTEDADIESDAVAENPVVEEALFSSYYGGVDVDNSNIFESYADNMWH